MASELDFNRLLEQMVNRPIESAVEVSGGFANAGNELGTFLFFLMIFMFILLVFGLIIGFVWVYLIKKN